MSRSGQGIEGAVAVVTGASSGIGRATAQRLAQRGGHVVLAARSEGHLQETARECQQAGGQALAVPTDVGDEAAVQEPARRALERFGQIDVWVNNVRAEHGRRRVPQHHRGEDPPPRRRGGLALVSRRSDDVSTTS